jgi:hypothetical protein
MKNIQVIDSGDNCTYDIFQATEEEFALIFPDETDIEFIEDFFSRVGEETAINTLNPIWERRLDKKKINGIHGTLFYDLENKKIYYPTKKEAEMIAYPTPTDSAE